jgi:hypothetical protein
MATGKPKKISADLTGDKSTILWSFLDFTEEGEAALARCYLVHCGMDAVDIDVQDAILRYGWRGLGAAPPQSIKCLACKGIHSADRWQVTNGPNCPCSMLPAVYASRVDPARPDRRPGSS